MRGLHISKRETMKFVTELYSIPTSTCCTTHCPSADGRSQDAVSKACEISKSLSWQDHPTEDLVEAITTTAREALAPEAHDRLPLGARRGHASTGGRSFRANGRVCAGDSRLGRTEGEYGRHTRVGSRSREGQERAGHGHDRAERVMETELECDGAALRKAEEVNPRRGPATRARQVCEHAVEECERGCGIGMRKRLPKRIERRIPLGALFFWKQVWEPATES
jgi:hypothetical protein